MERVVPRSGNIKQKREPSSRIISKISNTASDWKRNKNIKEEQFEPSLCFEF